MVPSLMPSMTSWGSIPSTVQPTDWAVPRTSFIVPENSLAMDRGAITRAAAMMSSMVMLPLCWMFFTFFRSLGGSFSALMTRAAAEGTTEQVACLKVDFQEKLSETFTSSTCSGSSAGQWPWALSSRRSPWRCRHQSSLETDPVDPPLEVIDEKKMKIFFASKQDWIFLVFILFSHLGSQRTGCSNFASYCPQVDILHLKKTVLN